MKTRSLLTALVALFLLTACGVARQDLPTQSGPLVGSPSPVDPEAPVSSTPDAGGLPSGGGAERVRPRPGMADLRAVAWEKARQTSSRSLRVTYWSGVEPCNVLDHVDVDYTDSKVIVTLYEGHDPDADDVACIEIALMKVVVVDLEEPVDGREIKDGAR